MTPPRITAPLLALALAVPHAFAGDDDVEITVLLPNLGVDLDAKAEARWRDKGDSTDFQVEIEDVAAGSYELVLDG